MKVAAVALLAVLAVASASDPFMPKYTGFESKSTKGTITLFTKPEHKNADMAAILSNDKEAGYHKISGNGELFAASPLATEGYTDVRPGQHGFVFRSSKANKEVYCQREAGADDQGTEVTEGSRRAHKFEFHCAEYKDPAATSNLRFKRNYAWGGWVGGWGGWGGWGGGYYNGWGGYGGWGGSPWYGGYGGYGGW